jgi:hypothetical protein
VYATRTFYTLSMMVPNLLKKNCEYIYIYISNRIKLLGICTLLQYINVAINILTILSTKLKKTQFDDYKVILI